MVEKFAKQPQQKGWKREVGRVVAFLSVFTYCVTESELLPPDSWELRRPFGYDRDAMSLKAACGLVLVLLSVRGMSWKWEVSIFSF